MNRSWAWDAMFYHIYPLGLCGAPAANDFTALAQPRLNDLRPWVAHARALGCNALYLGPLFESSTHGYDTADYFAVDRRLGDNATLAGLVADCHAQGVRVILDGVFHHVGRDFWAFRDLQQHSEQSAYRDWFHGVDFGRRSPYGDQFAYDGWNGHYSLVKLNLRHPDVRAHLFAAVRMWVEQFAIDGLRLDAADVMDLTFLGDLASFCRSLRPDFWLLGEVIHGDYRLWARPDRLDSVTNYEAYKGLYSSHNDRNYFELAHTLKRQFGPEGLYRGLPLYSFADNHDVDRVASALRNPAHLYPLHALMMTMPGVPSIYYGGEWGIGGMKQGGDDRPLRPALRLHDIQAPHPGLAAAIARFAGIRRQHGALRYGDYQEILVAHEQLAFARRSGGEYILVVANASAQPISLDLPVDLPGARAMVDLLDPTKQIAIQHGRALAVDVPACWARILRDFNG